MNDLVTFLVGVVALACELPVIYRIYRKMHSKESIIVTGKIIAFRVGGGLKKTYIPVVEILVNGVIQKIVAKDNMALKEKYPLHTNVLMYYNESVNKCKIFIMKDYGSLIYAIIIILLGMGIIMCVVLGVLFNGLGGYTRIRPWM